MTISRCVPFESQTSLHLATIPPTSRISLANLPTPLSQVPGSWGNESELWIKREDMAGVELSGNKARKLEYLLADAIDKGASLIITCGGVQSNQCRATAAACAKIGLKCLLLLRLDEGQTVQKIDPLQGNLLLDQLFGAQLQFVTSKEYTAKGGHRLLQEAATKLQKDNQVPYTIPLGAVNAIGSWGFVVAVEELIQQVDKMNIRMFDTICLAAGSGGTLAGILTGLWRLQVAQVKVLALTPCDDTEIYIRMLNELLPAMGVADVQGALRPLKLQHAKGMSFKSASNEDVAFVSELAKASGVLLDPMYMGKALRAACSEIKDKERVLFWHTGSIFSLAAFSGMFTIGNTDPIPQIIRNRSGKAIIW